ncbi:MAG TPA: N(4)-(beta-N-acetylglucosaminyl)-L-asparaginase [Fimbriimonadaceae bacterium]|nr:N(4)-(beta-N-acetylglucosaminyl)-L-asparaginase [Fimbriimonadaceae bacterium]
MPRDLSRREFIGAGAAVALAPNILIQSEVKPVVISSGNGFQFKNAGNETCVERAFRLLTSGRDVLESLIEGVNIVELDPLDSSVGYGGVPNANGVVQLDSCCMHGPKKWAGGVAALEGIRTPSKVAYQVASMTDHHLLVGKGAQEFAQKMGFQIESDLNTERSRAAWLEWLRRTDPDHYLDPRKRGDGEQVALQMAREGWFDPEHVWGTINCDGINAKGEIAGVTTTSGLAFKIPGRVGDSPILGAGLYVDNTVGAAGSTGRGEANLYGLCSYLVVEEMRRGKHPKDAGIEALRRVAANTVEKRLLNDRGRPNFGLNFYALDAKGRYAGVTMSGRARFAVCDEKGPRFEDCEPLYA